MRIRSGANAARNLSGDARGQGQAGQAVGAAGGTVPGVQLPPPSVHSRHDAVQAGALPDVSLRTARDCCPWRAVHAHLPGLPAGTDATTQLGQADIRDTVAVPRQPAICLTEEPQPVRYGSKLALRLTRRRVQRPTSETLQARPARSSEDQRGLPTAHRRHHQPDHAASEGVRVPGGARLPLRRSPR